MNKLLVTGGAQRPDASRLGEGRRYHSAYLVELDFETGAVRELVSIKEGNKNYPDDLPNITFTCCTLDGDRLYLCTETEVFVYRYPELKLINSASYKFFQNSHHVSPVGEYVAVVSTGLDLVAFLDKETLHPVRLLNALGKDPWHRFSPDVDYRKVHTTKPHESHPNFVFPIDGEPWVTRFNQKDAVCLSDMRQRIDIGLERLHDGHVIGNRVYFTTVDGRIVCANTHTRRIERVFDLNKMGGEGVPLGWCRGLLVEENIAYVGFSRIRQTAIKENVKWLLGQVGRKYNLPSRIARYDLVAGIKLGEVELPRGMVDAVYSVVRA
jgi:hypothetical protein